MHHVGIDPGINNVLTASRVIGLEEGTLYTLPGQHTHPDGRRPLSSKERAEEGLPAYSRTQNGRTMGDRLYRATPDDVKQYARRQSVALTKGTLDDHATALAVELQLLEAEHHPPEHASEGERQRHRAAFNQHSDTIALREELMRVEERQRDLASEAMLEWLLMREGGVMEKRHQGWDRQDALVVVSVGNWR